MAYAKKFVLHCQRGYEPRRVEALVEAFMREKVRFVAAVGPDCGKIEDIVDEIVVGDGTREPYEMLTSSHPHENVFEALKFAESLTGDFEAPLKWL